MVAICILSLNDMTIWWLFYDHTSKNQHIYACFACGDSWKNKLTMEQIREIENGCKEFMDRNGYEAFYQNG